MREHLEAETLAMMKNTYNRKHFIRNVREEEVEWREIGLDTKTRRSSLRSTSAMPTSSPTMDINLFTQYFNTILVK